MQKSRFVEANVDEGRLHAGQNTGHFAQINIAHQTTFQRAFDMQLLHRAKFDHSDPCFLGRPIDQNILLHGGHQMGKRKTIRKTTGHHQHLGLRERSTAQAQGPQQSGSLEQRQTHDA